MVKVYQLCYHVMYRIYQISILCVIDAAAVEASVSCSGR